MKTRGNNGHSRLAGAAIRCQPDSRLVGLIRDGHDVAFEEIVRRYRSQLVSYAGAIVPEHRAEDVVQEALTRAHTALGRNESEMNLRPWLYTIVRNGALNSLRNEPVYVHLDENYDGVPQPPEVAARREELAALTASVKDLPEPQREALVKRELEGRSHDEIAASLGVSAGAVRGLIYRARATLRDAAGMLIPLPVLRALLSAGPMSSDATGTAAAGLAAGGGGVALKAGATLGVAVIAVGSGIAIQQRNSGASERSSAGGPSHSAHAIGPNGPSGVRLADSAASASARGGNEGPGSASSGPGSGGDGSSGSSSGPGSGSGEHSGSGGSSGPGSGGSGGDDGGRSGSGGSGGGSSGPGGGGDDGISGHDGGGGTSGSGGTDDGTSGHGGGGEISGEDGGSSGSGSSGSGSSGSGSSGSGSGSDDGGTSGDSSGSGSSGSGSGDDGTTTTTTDGGGGSSGSD